MGFNLFKEISRPFKKAVKEVDRALDRRIGIDDPGIRKGVLIVGSAVVGGVAGGVVSGGLGGAGSAALGSVSAGGITATATTASLAGGFAGARLASKALEQGFEFPGAPAEVAVRPPRSFGGDILSSQNRLRRQLASKRGLRSTNRTGGISGFSQTIRPTLMTL